MTTLENLHRELLGFQKFFSPHTNFPPYNTIKTPQGYQIEVAVAGYTKDELDVYVEDEVLVVEGNKEDEKEVDYLYKGIAHRAFRRTWTLHPNLKVASTHLKDGILTITMTLDSPTKSRTKIEVM